jgi:hypothetical protein
MATPLSLAAIPNLFKTLYPDGIESLVIAESPTLGLIQKNGKAFKGFAGAGKELDWRIANGGQASPTFATAQSNAGVSTHQKPYITRAPLYVVRQIDHQSMEASESNAGALITLLKEATTTAMDELRRRAGSVLLGDGTGAIGQISATSNVATTTITLADPAQVVNFFVGQRVSCFTAGDAAASTVLTVTVVDEDTGNITLGAAWNTMTPAAAALDYIVPESDYKLVAKGLFAWNPPTLPTTSDNFFGLDRSYSVPMCGCRYAPTTGSIDEVFKDAMARHARQGGDHDTLIVAPDDWSSLEKQSNNWQRINKNAVGTNGKEIASIGFNALVMNGPKGPVNVFSDPYMPRYKAKLIKLASVELWSLNDPFRLLTAGAPNDGMLRLAASDASELRYGGYWNIAIRRPRDLMDITIPTG